MGAPYELIAVFHTSIEVLCLSRQMTPVCRLVWLEGPKNQSRTQKGRDIVKSACFSKEAVYVHHWKLLHIVLIQEYTWEIFLPIKALIPG